MSFKKKPISKTTCTTGINIEISEKLIIQLIKIHKVKTFCLCPGGRSAPLISVVSQAKGLEVFSFFEERAAGFFALGRCRRDKRPCAVITTSGTAVAELLPSVIEAYYSHVPLVLITADRPSSYRNTGAPQSINQPGIFSHYVQSSWDLEKNTDFDLSSWDRLTPCHINICFDEPLIDKKNIKQIKAPEIFSTHTPSQRSTTTTHWNTSLAKQEKQIESFFSKVTKPLCIVSELPETVRQKIENTLSFFACPIYAEALSGLRESPKLHPFILKSGENFLNWLVLNKKIDGIIRIGRRPCTRFWRDLENTFSFMPILSVSDQAYSGLSRSPPVVSFPSFFQWSPTYKKSSEQKEIFAEDKLRSQFLTQLMDKHPLSEPALVKQLFKKIPSRSLLFLGNSLPIREWNLAADYQPDKQLKYTGNRGANGIDGLLSTFFGICEKSRQNWCLIGDLSCLYDLSAPWILQQLNQSTKFFLVVLNNGGGQIFSSLFSNPIFLNSHNLQFKQWAKMWNLNYYCIHQWPKTLSFSSPAVIELKVNPAHTKKFETDSYLAKK